MDRQPDIGLVCPSPYRSILSLMSRITNKFPISDCPQSASIPVNFPCFTPQAQSVINAFAGGAGTPQSEDCLTLNIWVPRLGGKLEKQKKQPALVFFHGGRES